MADSMPCLEDFFEENGAIPVTDSPVISTEPTPVPSQKAMRRKRRKAEREEKQARRTPKPIEPRNDAQAAYIHSLMVNELTFSTGPAGVGKTYVPSRLYGEMLATGRIEKIYVARPNVSKPKHRNGFLPGTLEEKTAPWLVPVFEGIKDSMGPQEFERFKREKKIEEVPFEFMQGRTFKNSAFIVDEAENLDLDDLYITLTRLGEDCFAVFCGDIYQARISDSGLATVVRMAGSPEMEEVGIIEFSVDDIVRSRQAKQWAKAFRTHWGHNNLHGVAACGNDGPSDFHSDPPNFLKGGT